MVSRIYVQGSRDAVVTAIRDVVKAAAGTPNQYSNDVAGVHTTIGFAALSDIKDDFVRKARGQTGEDGVTWAPLSPKTLAYSRRFGPGEQSRLKKAAGLGRANNRRGLLTATQDKRWRKVYAQSLAWLATKMPFGQAKAQAGKIAWSKLKQEGAKTKLEVFGNRPHEILRDTGVLLNSLSPGQFGNDGVNLTYLPPGGEGGDQQVFTLQPSGVIVGTNVPYARKHQNGDPRRGIPARPFIPRNGMPSAWTRNWASAGARSLVVVLRQALQGVR